MIAGTRIPAALVAGALVLSLGAALALARVPPQEAAIIVLAATASLAVGAWALVDLPRFVMFGVLSAMIVPLALVQPAGAQVALGDLLLVVALGAWLVAAAAHAAPAPWTAGNRLLAPTLLVAVVAGASLAWSVGPFDTVKATVQTVEIAVVLPLVFASLPRSVAEIRRGMLVYVGATCILAVVTLALFLPRAAAGDLTGQYLPGLHKNAIGSFLAAGLVLAYGFWLAEGRPGVRRALGLAAFLELAGLFASVSRGALIGALFAVLIASALLRRRRVVTVALAVVAAIVFMAVIGTQPQPAEPGPGGGYDSSEVREYSFANAVEKIAERPVLGTGAGTYQDYLVQLDIGLSDPNNLFLLTWAEVGVIGLAALVFLLYRFGRLLVAARRLPHAAAVPAVAAGGVTISLLVHFQVDSTWNRGTASLAFAMMGLLLAAGRLAPGLGASTAPVAPGPSEPETAAAEARAADPPEPETPAAATTAAVAAVAVNEGPATTGQDSRPLRVLHVLTSDAFAGIERHVVRLARDLRALGCAAELACPPSAARLREEATAAGVPVHPSATRRPRAWLGAVAREVAAQPPDVIHLHDGRSALAGILLAPLGRGLVVRTQHFTRPASVERSGWRREASLGLHRGLNRKLDGYVAVSQSVADEARGRRETHTAHVAVIPPGIELPGDEELARARAARDRLAHPVVVYIGRLEPEKRLDVLLRAILPVLERLPDCRFVIAGSGAAGEQLRLDAGRLGIAGSITWTGEVAHAAGVLEDAHVFVTPSPAEGFGLATAEAMAFGLPAVAVASGGSAEVVEDGVSGLLVPAGDATALASALVELAGDRPRAERMGAQARRRAIGRYGADHTARATLAFYRRLREGART